MRFLLYSSFLLLCAFNLKAQVIINEISYNPPESGTDSLEYIELFNAGNSEVDLTGWHFTSGVEDTFPAVQLAPGEYFVTAINAAAVNTVFHINVHQWSDGALNNSGESIILVDAGGNFIDSVAYDDADPWPIEADGTGPSLELKPLSTDNNDGANWQASGGATGVIINGSEVFGTPGAQNSGGGSTGGPAVTVEVAHLDFTPQHVVIAVGDSVRWVNNESIPHNVNGTQATYPDNAESFTSGAPAVGPWQYDHEFNVPGFNDYHCNVHVSSGMTGTVSVYDPNGYTEFPLEHLRLTNENGQAIFDGVPTTVTGVVHGINFQTTGASFYIINENNIGINVFTPDPFNVVQGEELQISGVIDQFNGLLEIIPDDIQVLSTGNQLVEPDPVTVLDESTESSYLYLYDYTIDSIVATGTSGWNIYTKTADGVSVLVRLDSDTGLTPDAVSGNWINGIGSQFDNQFPFTEGYQLLALEFLFVDGIEFLDKSAISLQPNPANDFIQLNSELTLKSVEIYSMDGRMLITKSVSGGNVDFSISHLPQGLYTIQAKTAEGIWTSLLSVIK